MDIIMAVAVFYNKDINSLILVKKGTQVEKEARTVARYLCHEYFCRFLKEIASYFNLKILAQ